jgi:hypothetical protein
MMSYEIWVWIIYNNHIVTIYIYIYIYMFVLYFASYVQENDLPWDFSSNWGIYHKVGKLNACCQKLQKRSKGIPFKFPCIKNIQFYFLLTQLKCETKSNKDRK